jgi:hypothetical protein
MFEMCLSKQFVNRKNEQLKKRVSGSQCSSPIFLKAGRTLAALLLVLYSLSAAKSWVKSARARKKTQVQVTRSQV